VVSDIRVVANKKFAEENPAAKKFFEEFSLPLADVNRQNTLMQDGEDSQADIERHAAEWVKENQEKWDGWLKAARAAAK
jgi:glycine betaine/proline transport system substrate-binding protein